MGRRWEDELGTEGGSLSYLMIAGIPVMHGCLSGSIKSHLLLSLDAYLIKPGSSWQTSSWPSGHGHISGISSISLHHFWLPQQHSRGLGMRTFALRRQQRTHTFAILSSVAHAKYVLCFPYSILGWRPRGLVRVNALPSSLF